MVKERETEGIKVKRREREKKMKKMLVRIKEEKKR